MFFITPSPKQPPHNPIFISSIVFTRVFAESSNGVIDITKASAAIVTATALTTSAPAMAMDSIIASLPSETLSLEVQFGAYLAVLLGTLLPVLFLVNLYTQSESRKAGKQGGQDSS